MTETEKTYAGKTAKEWEDSLKDSLGCLAITGFFGYVFLALGFGFYLGAGAFFIVMALGLLLMAVRFWFVAKEEKAKQKKAEGTVNTMEDEDDSQ